MISYTHLQLPQHSLVGYLIEVLIIIVIGIGVIVFILGRLCRLLILFLHTPKASKVAH